MQSEHLPGVAVQSDADILKDFRARAGSVYHASCTCAMGVDPASSVVDARLRVHGIASLRVVDASVFPSLITVNINAAVMMVAEKAATLIPI